MLSLPPRQAIARPAALTSLLRPPSHSIGRETRPVGEGLSTLVRSLGVETRHTVAGRDLRVGIAQTPWQAEQAHALVMRQYRQAGFSLPSLTAKTQDRAVTLLAMHGINPMATLTLNADGPGGLFADQHYGAQLDQLRDQGARLCEFVRFAASSEIPVLAMMGSLLRCAWQIGRGNHAISDVVIECHPRHASFYRRILGFRPAGAPTTCSRVGAPAVLLHMPVAELERRMSREQNADTLDDASLSGFLGVPRLTFAA